MVQTGFPRAFLAAPLLRKGEAVGTITIRRDMPGPFTHSQVTLLQTFADQAVIAIENVRLFQELGARNRDLTEALDRETATSDILRAIAMSPTDPTPVFEAILDSALRLCRASIGALLLSDGRLVSVVAVRGRAAWVEAAKSACPRSLYGPGLGTRAVREGVTSTCPMYSRSLRVSTPREAGEIGLSCTHPCCARGGASVPSRWRARRLGCLPTRKWLWSTRWPTRPPSPSRTCGCSRSSRRGTRSSPSALARQTATSEILQVISRSPTATEPVFEAIVKSASRLLGGARTVLTHRPRGRASSRRA